jgi:alkylation response protein AidB-like acyl-CoA dehydrogenase
MDFSLNDDHLALRDAVQRFCDGEYPLEHRGQAETPERCASRWSGMAGLGGSEQGPVEVMLVAQELGRALGGGAFVASTVMAGQLLTRLGSPGQQQRWLPGMASGELQATVALYEDGARYDWQRVSLHARAVEGGHVINGRKTGVLHGDTAGLLLVVARGEGDGLSVFAVDANAPGVRIQGFNTLDNRRAAHVDFNDVAVDASRLLGAPGQAGEAVEAALDAAIAALCAEAVGVVDALIVHTAEHLRTRKQFGAPLAKFQVLQHRLADMAIALEQLKSMACVAALAVDAQVPAQRRRLVSAAKVLVSQQGRELGLQAIQMHGAMGMTDECRISHYAKRLLVIGQLFGDACWHLQSLVAAPRAQAA